MSVGEEGDGLEAKGRVGGVAAEKAGHDDLASDRRDEKRGIGTAESGEKTDDEATRDIGYDSAPRERFAEELGGEFINKYAGAYASSTAGHDGKKFKPHWGGAFRL